MNQLIVPQAVGRVYGEPILEIPRDLYIPPEALEVVLEAFQGPLDLLLYLIRKHNIDVLDIPMAELTRQYMEYVEVLRHHQLEIAAEYLLMAALLIEIKSRMLLPKPVTVIEDEEDPRSALVRRLLEYEQMKTAAENLDKLPRAERDFTLAHVLLERTAIKLLPHVNPDDLKRAWEGLIQRASINRHHKVIREELSVREQMSRVLRELRQYEFIEFARLFIPERGIPHLVVVFLALLELVREKMIEVSQSAAFELIYVKLSHGQLD